MSQLPEARVSRNTWRATIAAALGAFIIALLIFVPSTVHAATITFVSNSSSYGTVSKASASIPDGQRIGAQVAKATAKSGYRFDGWYLGGTKVGTSLKNQTAKANANYLAFFTKGRVSSQNHSGATALDTMGLIVDRYLSAKGANGGVILATTKSFPDALAASALSGATGYPIVLTEPDALSPQAAKRIKSSGAQRVIVVGGESAVSADTASAAQALADKNANVYTTSPDGQLPSGEPTRYWGETALDTAVEVYNANRSEWGSTIVIATGGSFQDALSISPYCYREKAPILLAKEGALPDAAKDALAEAAGSGSATDIVIVGGVKVVSEDTEAYLEGLFPGHVTRLAGADAYQTSLKVAAWLVDEQGFQENLVGFATGKSFSDAVAAGPLQGATNAPLVLVADSPAGKVGERWFVRRANYEQARFFGGVKAVPQGIRDEVELHLLPSSVVASRSWYDSGSLSLNYACYAYATASRLSTPKAIMYRAKTYKYQVGDNGWAAVNLGSGKGLAYLPPGSWVKVSADSGSKWGNMIARGQLKAFAAPSSKARVMSSKWLYAYAYLDARKYDSAGTWYAVKTAGGKDTFYVMASQLRKPTAGENGAHRVMKANNNFGNDLKKAFNWAKNHRYRHISGNNYGSTSWAEKYAAEFFSKNSGNCYSFAAAFCYLARQMGYNANVHAGYVPAARGGAAPHGWVEIKRGGKTYICDPELAHEIPGRNWYMNTYATAPTYYTR